MSERIYRKPKAWQKWFNAKAAKFGIGETLIIAGRTSGESRTVTISPIVVAGQEYLVSPRGETDWVRNLRAAQAGELKKRDRVRPFTAVEIEGNERVRIIESYKSKLGRIVAREFAALPEPDDHPTFLIKPTA